MRRFVWSPNLCHISDEELALWEAAADLGDPEASYRCGRYLSCILPHEDSPREAYAHLMLAKEAGIPDADAALAQLYGGGLLGRVDIDLKEELLQGALERGSELAMRIRLDDLLYGAIDRPADPEAALAYVEELLSSNDNPIWLHMKGLILALMGRREESISWFDRAIEAGVVQSIPRRALALYSNDEGDITNQEAMWDAFVDGYEKEEALSAFLLASILINGYKMIEETKKSEWRERILQLLQSSVKWGCNSAAYQLGDIYHEGLCGVATDNDKAWEWYALGARAGSPECFECLYQMAVGGESNASSEGACSYALEGVRLGSTLLLEPTIEAYRAGLLAKHADEIEQYYLPRYENR